MKIYEVKEVKETEIYILGKPAREWLMALVFTVVIIGVLIQLATADTIILNYSQCETYTDSNGTEITYCAADWLDLNLTDVRMNATFYLTGSAELHNETWNVTFNSTAPKYNTVLTPDFGANQTHYLSNVTCQGQQFPALNYNATLAQNTSYAPADARYNLSLSCQQFTFDDCRENIDTTLSWDGEYYSSRCNIHVRGPPRPWTNATRNILSGALWESTTEFYSSYSCENKTPEILTLQAEKVLVQEQVRQINESFLNKDGELMSLNTSYQAAMETISKKDADYALLQTEKKAIESEFEGYMAGDEKYQPFIYGIALILGVAGAGIYYLRSQQNMPLPDGGNESPINASINAKLKPLEEAFKKMKEKEG